MKLNETLTVLICCHSKDEFHDSLLQRALNSLVSQTYKTFKVVVVLDECWEDTEETVFAFADNMMSNGRLNIACYNKPKKEGLAVAKNFGINLCKTDWIAYLDADDSYEPTKLEVQREFLINNPDVDICGTQAWDVYNVGTSTENKKENCFAIGKYENDTQIKLRLPYENVLCHGSVMMRKNTLNKLGGYDIADYAKGREDYMLWQKAATQGFRFYNIPKRLYNYSMGTSVER